MIKDILKQLPKIELHLHLEGAIPLEALWQLVEKYGRVSDVGDIAGLEERFKYKDFRHFIETWLWKNEFLREYEDFTFIASRVAEDLARQNIRYVEAFYSPGDFARHGLETQGLTEAIRNGLDMQAERISVNLVADLIRDFGPEKGMSWLEEVHEVKDFGVVGIGIGGAEHLFPPEPYKRVYEQARKLGFKTSAHAGEAAGPESVWGALKTLKVDRVGHGTRAIEDTNLVSFLKEKQVPIEMCPISNLRTGVTSDLTLHPIREFYDAGLLVSVNTDDPKMFNNSLEEEYSALMEFMGFELDDVVRMMENAIESAWCENETKNILYKELSEFSQNIVVN